MTMTTSTFDPNVDIWVNPEDKSDVFTVQDIFDYQELGNTVRQYLAEHEDGNANRIQEAFERLAETAEKLNFYPGPCPLCGRYGGHAHNFE